MADDYQVPAVEWQKHIAENNRAKSHAIAKSTQGRRSWVQARAELENRLDKRARVFLRNYQKCKDWEQMASLMIICDYATPRFAETSKTFIREESNRQFNYLKTSYSDIWQAIQQERAERKPEQKSLF